jgi:hypothetical protein
LPPLLCPQGGALNAVMAEPTSSSARAAPLRTAAPTVKTKKNVPMNSTIIFRVVGWSLTAVGAGFVTGKLMAMGMLLTKLNV